MSLLFQLGNTGKGGLFGRKPAPRSRLPCLAGRLEVQAKSELSKPRSPNGSARTAGCITHRRGDLAEARACEGGDGVREVRMVEEVEEIGSEVQPEPLGQREILRGRQVEVHQSRTVVLVATFGAYLACRDGGEVAGVEGSIRALVMLDQLSSTCVWTIGKLVETAVICTAQIDRKGEPRLNLGDARHRPAFKRLTRDDVPRRQEHLSRTERQWDRVVAHKAVTHVERRVAILG